MNEKRKKTHESSIFDFFSAVAERENLMLHSIKMFREREREKEKNCRMCVREAGRD